MQNQKRIIVFHNERNRERDDSSLFPVSLSILFIFQNVEYFPEDNEEKLQEVLLKSNCKIEKDIRAIVAAIIKEATSDDVQLKDVFVNHDRQLNILKSDMSPEKKVEALTKYSISWHKSKLVSQKPDSGNIPLCATILPPVCQTYLICNSCRWTFHLIPILISSKSELICLDSL
jgi:hypothetical protein